MENYSKPSVANFGRSLLGGYCPTYVPDFVLHGTPSDDKLRQNLTAELAHAVQVRSRALWKDSPELFSCHFQAQGFAGDMTRLGFASI